MELSWAEQLVENQGDFKIVCPAAIYQVTAFSHCRARTSVSILEACKERAGRMVGPLRQDRDTGLFTSRWVGLKQW